MAYTTIKPKKWIPQNPKKYMGDAKDIVARSSYETKFFNWCDQTKNVVQWSSETVVVPYVSPIDGKYHRYFVDGLIKVQQPDGSIQVFLIEIKPEKFSKPPELPKSGRKTKSYITEVYQWGVNEAKWKAAREYALDRNWRFIVITEKDLQINKK